MKFLITATNLIYINKSVLNYGIDSQEETLYISNRDAERVIKGEWQAVVKEYYHLYKGIELESEDEHILRAQTNDGVILISFKNLVRKYV